MRSYSVHDIKIINMRTLIIIVCYLYQYIVSSSYDVFNPSHAALARTYMRVQTHAHIYLYTYNAYVHKCFNILQFTVTATTEILLYLYFIANSTIFTGNSCLCSSKLKKNKTVSKWNTKKEIDFMTVRTRMYFSIFFRTRYVTHDTSKRNTIIFNRMLRKCKENKKKKTSHSFMRNRLFIASGCWLILTFITSLYDASIT